MMDSAIKNQFCGTQLDKMFVRKMLKKHKNFNNTHKFKFQEELSILFLMINDFSDDDDDDDDDDDEELSKIRNY